MKKYMLSLTAVAALSSPFAYADGTLGATAPTPTTTPSTTTTTTASTPQTNQSVVQLKKSDGTTFSVTVDPQYLNASNDGQTLTIINVTPVAPTTTTTSTTTPVAPTTPSATTPGSNPVVP